MPEIEAIEVKGMIESSFLDWDGKIVTTLYLPKCNFRCPFCHNWELIEKPENFNTVSMAAIDRHIHTNHDFIDGVCITGGEPTLYDNLLKFIEHFREQGLNIKLDTNGSNAALVKELIEGGYVDYIAMDLKGPLDDRYFKLTGTSTNLAEIRKSIDIIMASAVDYEFRTTVVPTLLAGQDITDLVNSISGAKRYVLQQFVPDHARAPKLRKVKPYDKTVMATLSESVQDKIDNILIRGLK